MANPVKLIKGTLTRLLLKVCQVELLTREQTRAHLNPYQIDNNSAVSVPLPAVPNQGSPSWLVFGRTDAITEPGYVWRYDPDDRKVAQLPYGGIVTDTSLLCLDYMTYHLVHNFLVRKKRIPVNHHTVIAPWSHRIDGIAFGGYYDFVILIAAKLSRIKEALEPDVFNEALLSYPLFNTTYEREFLSLLGVNPDRIVDSRTHELRFQQCILANSGHWFYPHPADIKALKKYIEPNLAGGQTEKKRIYISRAGRRRVINEASLIRLLRTFDFVIIEDEPRSVAEQISIYKNASFIMGPHGASFTNIIWCDPGTHLFELFSPTMVVGHFLYLSQVMQMSYTAYHHVVTMNNRDQRLAEDIFVSIADIENALHALLGQPETRVQARK